MTDKRKKNIRELASQLGVNRRAAASLFDQGRRDRPTSPPAGTAEVLVFDEAGRQLAEIVWFVPPGILDGRRDPEGLIMSSARLRGGGRYMLVEANGRAWRVRTGELSAGGGAYKTVSNEPDTFVGVQVTYASADLDEHGMPTTFARYMIVPDRNPPPTGYMMGVLPITDGATMRGLRSFGFEAWRELFALLDTVHTGLARRVAVGKAESSNHETNAPDVNKVMREAAGVRGEVQGRVLRTKPLDVDPVTPTTQTELDELGAADRIFNTVLRAQMDALRQNPLPPGLGDHVFEVVVPSGRSTVTVLRGATLATAHARARHEARARRTTVYLRNAITGVTQPVKPKL